MIGDNISRISPDAILEFRFGLIQLYNTELYGGRCLPPVNTFSGHITSNVALLTPCPVSRSENLGRHPSFPIMGDTT